MDFFESTAVTVLGVGSSFYLYVIGQSDPVIPGEVTTLGTAAIGSGFLIWYARHVTSVLIPKLVADHEEKVKSIVDRHDATINKLVDEFREESQQQREEHQRETNRLILVLRPDQYDRLQDQPADAMRPTNKH